MPSTILAESGLSECHLSPGCVESFNEFLVDVAVGIVVLLAWFIVGAFVSIAAQGRLTGSAKALAIGSAWVVPVVGSAVYVVLRNRRSTRHRPAPASDGRSADWPR